MPTELTPAQKKHASYPVSFASTSLVFRKSGTRSCSSFGCVWFTGLRETVSTFSTASFSRHSSRTPSPTMPVTPVRMMRMGELYTHRQLLGAARGRSAHEVARANQRQRQQSGHQRDRRRDQQQLVEHIEEA